MNRRLGVKAVQKNNEHETSKVDGARLELRNVYRSTYAWDHFGYNKTGLWEGCWTGSIRSTIAVT